MAQSERIRPLVEAVLRKAEAKGLMVATAESCTGGLVGAALTDAPGSSAVFERGFVTYSNEAKADMLGVPMTLILAHGAVSAEVARAMATGALARSRADIAVSVTGIAGPDGGTIDKPVGLVWFGLATQTGAPRTERRLFANETRDGVRTMAVETALSMLSDALSD